MTDTRGAFDTLPAFTHTDSVAPPELHQPQAIRVIPSHLLAQWHI